MTRMEKHDNYRIEIEIANIQGMLNNFDEWYYIRTHQKEIKEEMGCKH